MESSITLLNGTVLPCYPINRQDSKVVPDRWSFDMTGTYLTFGKRKPKKEPAKSDEQKALERLFTDNAFFMYQHRERILGDSLMFLAPVTVQNGLFYTGVSGFRNPTLGVYAEWWNECKDALRTNEDGELSLLYYLSGSPLSGVNYCKAVCADGRIEDVNLHGSFPLYWQSFMRINRRYTEAKQIYKSYTLQEVINQLIKVL